MRIGVPKEIKPQESRIGLTPNSVKILTSNGHEVLVENNGGFEAGFYNNQYIKAGAKIVDKAEDIFNDADIIVKVKEPLSNEVKMIRENQIVFTYLHLAAAKELTEGLVKSKSICIAYETVTDNNGRLPLLAPMSAVAGRMSIGKKSKRKRIITRRSSRRGTSNSGYSWRWSGWRKCCSNSHRNESKSVYSG